MGRPLGIVLAGDDRRSAHSDVAGRVDLLEKESVTAITVFDLVEPSTAVSALISTVTMALMFMPRETQPKGNNNA